MAPRPARRDRFHAQTESGRQWRIANRRSRGQRGVCRSRRHCHRDVCRGSKTIHRRGGSGQAGQRRLECELGGYNNTAPHLSPDSGDSYAHIHRPRHGSNYLNASTRQDRTRNRPGDGDCWRSARHWRRYHTHRRTQASACNRGSNPQTKWHRNWRPADRKLPEPGMVCPRTTRGATGLHGQQMRQAGGFAQPSPCRIHRFTGK